MEEPIRLSFPITKPRQPDDIEFVKNFFVALLLKRADLNLDAFNARGAGACLRVWGEALAFLEIDFLDAPEKKPYFCSAPVVPGKNPHYGPQALISINQLTQVFVDAGHPILGMSLLGAACQLATHEEFKVTAVATKDFISDLLDHAKSLHFLAHKLPEKIKSPFREASKKFGLEHHEFIVSLK